MKRNADKVLKKIKEINPRADFSDIAFIVQRVEQTPDALKEQWRQRVLTIPGLVHRDSAINSIREVAQSVAREIQKKYALTHDDRDLAKASVHAIQKAKELEIEAPRLITWDSFFARVTEVKWWERKLRTKHLQLKLDLGRDSKAITAYADDHTVDLVAQSVAKGYVWIQDKYLQTYDGNPLLFRPNVSPKIGDEPEDWEEYEDEEKLSLRKVADSAEKSRQALTAAKLAYLEKLINEKGMAVAMLTLTVPGAYRPDKDDPHSIKACRDWLTQMENRVSALVAKENKKRIKQEKKPISFCGIKCTQPHKDATPHRHVILVTHEQDIGWLLDCWRNVALSIHGDEEGAAEHRCRIDLATKPEDRVRMTRYASRYASRFVESKIREAVPQEAEETTIVKTVRGILEELREDAWYRASRTRRYSWFGLMPDNLWMSIRKQIVRDWRQHCPLINDDKGKRIPKWSISDFVQRWHKQHLPTPLFHIVEAVQNGDYHQFMKNIKHFVRIKNNDEAELMEQNLAWENITETKKNRYGEETTKTTGVRFWVAERSYTWEARLTEGEWMITDAQGGIFYEPDPITAKNPLKNKVVGVNAYIPRTEVANKVLDLYATAPP